MTKRGLTSIGIRKIIPGQIDYSKIVSGSAAGIGSFIAIDASGKAVLATPSGGGGVADVNIISGSSATYHNVSGSSGTFNFIDTDRIVSNQISGSSLIYHNISGSTGTYNLIDTDRIVSNQISGSNLTYHTISGSTGTFNLIDIDRLISNQASGSNLIYHTISGSTGTFNLIDADRIISNQASGSNLIYHTISGSTGTFNLIDTDRIVSNQFSGSTAIYHNLSSSTITVNDLDVNRVFANEVLTTSSFDIFYSQSLNSFKDDGVSSFEQDVFFGISTALKDANTLYVGAYEKYVTGSDGTAYQSHGSVYRFNYTPGSPDSDGSHWVQDMRVQMTASDIGGMFSAAPSDFGKSLAVMGSRIAVGSPGFRTGLHTQVGKVYIFRESGNSHFKEVDIDVSGTSNDRFGSVLDMSDNGTSIAIGSPFVSTNTGKVWMYRSGTLSAGWGQENVLQASDAAANDYFGYSLSLSSSYLAVGAPGCDTNTGAVYIFNSSSSGWSQAAILTSSHPAVNAYYGASVQLIDDKRVIVGEPKGWNASAAGLTGSVHIEKFFTTGTNRQKLLQVLRNPVSAQYNHFGRNVSAEVSGTYIAVSRPIGGNGSSADSTSDEGNRAVLLYETASTGYTLVQTLTRDTSIANYHNNQGGTWNNDHISELSNPWRLMDIKGTTIVHGIPSSNQSNFHVTGSGGSSEGGSLASGKVGEFRVWNEVKTTTGGRVSASFGRFTELTSSTIVGSLTKLSTGNDYLRSGTNMVLETGSDGSITISTTDGTMSTTNYVTNGTFQESPDGSRTTFTVSEAFVIGSQTVFRSGLYMTPGVGNDYTITNSTTIEFDGTDPPNSNENLRITFVKQ